MYGETFHRSVRLRYTLPHVCLVTFSLRDDVSLKGQYKFVDHTVFQYKLHVTNLNLEKDFLQ